MTGALGIITGSASTPGLFFSGDADSGIYSPGANQVAISTNGTGRLFVDASGNVGIGTTSPAVAFQVGATGSGGAAIDTTNSALHGTFGTGGGLSLRAQISSSSGGGDIFLGGSSRGDANVNSIVFSTANTSRAKIDANGYFTVSSNRFNGFEFIDSGATIYHSFGSGGNLTLRAQTTATAGGGEIFLGGSTRGDSNVNAIVFSGANSERARIDSSGRLLVGTSTAAAGTVETTAIVGAALTQSTGVRTVAASATLDLDIAGAGFVGHLYVSHVQEAGAGSRTNKIYFVTSRLGNATTITELNTANGSTSGFGFTITNPSGNVIRLTNTAASTGKSSMTFVGTLGF
jgi:hypothetical protein